MSTRPPSPPDRSAPLSRMTKPVLRIGMGLILLAWGVDKLAAVQGSQRIFAGFYHITAAPTLVQVAGAAEVLIAIALISGLFRRIGCVDRALESPDVVEIRSGSQR